MSWTKHFTVVDKNTRLNREIGKDVRIPDKPANKSERTNYLPDVYAGHPYRIERYGQYDTMDQDPEINAALDTISDFCTQPDDDSGMCFTIDYKGYNPSEAEVQILKTTLQQWYSLNSFRKKIWRIVRNTLKYGDQFFIRNPDTFEWFWVEPSKVQKIFVNEGKGKEITHYVVRDVDFNFVADTATNPSTFGTNLVGDGVSSLDRGNGLSTTFNQNSYNNNNTYSGNRTSRFNQNGTNVFAIDSTHFVHLSLSEGLDASWPFGVSVLEPVFKVYKQKELLEDAILIYRIQRAPERRVFYIDVGDQPPHKAQQWVERVKNEVHQRRIPSRNGQNGNVVDSSYNPMSMLEDFFFPVTTSGRGSKVETLPGGENLGQIDDLKFFNNKLIRGLRVPSSYLPTGPEDSTQAVTDGRVGTAYIQEFRFSKYCQRIQKTISDVFDQEFKLFVKKRGFNISSNTFELEFTPPQNFRQFAQIERDTAQINVFTPLSDVPYLSKRFILKRYLGLTTEEITENEILLKEENPDKFSEESIESDDNTKLSSIGIKAEQDDENQEEDEEDINNDREEGSESPLGSGTSLTEPERVEDE